MSEIPSGVIGEATSLLGENSPLTDRGLDNMGQTGEVRFVRYDSSVSKGYPNGLGRLSRLPTTPEDLGEKRGKWVVKPAMGSLLVLKKSHRDLRAQGQLAGERDALLFLQPHFTEESKARPARLLGYGITTRDSEEGEVPYLILEYIDPEFNDLDSYLKTKGKLSELEAMRIACGIIDILAIAHQQGFLHNDLGNATNVYWKPSTGEVRIIDWANTVNIGGIGRKSPNSYGHDRVALGEIIFRAVTGIDFSTAKQNKVLLESCFDKVGERTGAMIKILCGLVDNRFGDKAYDPRYTGGLGSALKSALRFLQSEQE